MAAALVLCGNKRSFFQDDVLPSSLHLSKRLRCSSSSSSSIPPQRVTPLRRPAEETEPERFGKRAKMTHHENLSAEEWAELFVGEMSSATSVDDAKARAANALQVFEQLIRSRAAAEAEVVTAQKEKENMVLKQENQEMKEENMILNERLKETEGRNQEYKKRVSTLEVDKYGLQLHLMQAQQCNTSIPLGFHPRVF
ncbi:PREDICTED: uncharacterized protein LOC101296699 [Fragaria vesca subsp. vesca]|uniref:uncharacterized protein LOC101296699 n=1 Tax=Fragaria vesca subsp. vesca TaxID=101020 RepID=UPI0002C31464|nr:PREDICTED: uncharacterized protein LOC101296699 [Fragaria vesca subsp. vesca]